jgi:ketosteroid isomerase-like protein
VWDRELSFAKSVSDHDAVAFAEHVHPSAVFVDGDGTYLRGRDAVVHGWATIIGGAKVNLMWHPTTVIADMKSGVALSRGPYLVEDPRPDAKNRFLSGTFQSIWVRDGDGAWRVFVDGGTPPPVPATPMDAEKIKAELRAPCAQPAGP